MPRFKLLAGKYVQAKYPQVRRKARLLESVPEERRSLDRLLFSELKLLAKEVGCPVDAADDEHSLTRRMVSDDPYNARDPQRNIITSEFDLEQKFGRNKFQNLDSMAAADPNNQTLLKRLEELERENAELRGKAPSAPSVDLRKMTVRQLQKYAAEEVGIEDLDDTWSKDQLIQAIESAVASV